MAAYRREIANARSANQVARADQLQQRYDVIIKHYFAYEADVRSPEFLHDLTSFVACAAAWIMSIVRGKAVG